MHALKLTTLQIIRYAGLLGLDPGELKECADDEEFIILVEEGILPPNVIREAPKPNSYELATQLVVMAPGSQASKDLTIPCATSQTGNERNRALKSPSATKGKVSNTVNFEPPPSFYPV